MSAELKVMVNNLIVLIHIGFGFFVGFVGVLLYVLAEWLRDTNYHLWTELFYPIKSSVFLGAGILIGALFLAVGIARRFGYLRLYVTLVLVELVIFPLGTILGAFSLWRDRSILK